MRILLSPPRAPAATAKNNVWRKYIMRLVAMTTIAWTAVFAGGFVLGLIPPVTRADLCHIIGSAQNCAGPGHGHLEDGMVAIKRPAAPGPSPPTSGQQHKHHNPFTLAKNWNGSRPLGALGVHGHAVPEGHKVIVRWTRYYGKSWGVPIGRQVFDELQCPERRCVLSDDKRMLPLADALLVHLRDVKSPGHLPRQRSPHQRWIAFSLESPYHTEINLTKFNGVFNWTSTYTNDSDIPVPYGAYVPYSRTDGGKGHHDLTDDAIDVKTRMAAWFVTNCKAANEREAYVRQLQQYIPVDIYGDCGHLHCGDVTQCMNMIRLKYKFYIAFENSNCRQYISEKFWHNALQNDAVPVVMGAPQADYHLLAPPHSFIHVDQFKSPKELARLLKVLSKDTQQYQTYFQWKAQGAGESHVYFQPRRSPYWCRLCERLHDPHAPRQVYHALDTWWSVRNQCTPRSPPHARV